MNVRRFSWFILSAAILYSALTIISGAGTARADSSKPVLLSLSSTAVSPGTKLAVRHQNFTGIGAWKAVIELQGGEKFEQTPVPVDSTSFTITVPAIYTGYNVTQKNAQHRQRIQKPKYIYIKKGAVVSNKLAFNIISYYPILDSIANQNVYAGDGILVNGGNWDKRTIYYPSQMYWAVFEYQPGKTVKANIQKPPVGNPDVPIPFLPDTCLVGILQITVPDVFKDKTPAEQNVIGNYTGKLYIYGPMGPGVPSNTLAIKIKKKPGGTTSSGSRCPGIKQFKDVKFVGQPSCGGASATLQCDGTGYYCCPIGKVCKSAGDGFEPSCSKYSSGGGSNVGLLKRDGVTWGCYK